MRVVKTARGKALRSTQGRIFPPFRLLLSIIAPMSGSKIQLISFAEKIIIAEAKNIFESKAEYILL